MDEKRQHSPSVLEVDFSRPAKLRGNRVGKLVRWSPEEGPVIDHSSNPHGPIAARSIVLLDEATVREAAAQDQEVLLVFEAERSDKPIIVGLVQPNQVERESREVCRGTGAAEFEALVDGKKIALQAEDEIVLRCGEASITLTKEGRIIVRGAYVETRSKGVNRIKGGVVRIN